jgi:hypothetical protein
LAAGAQELVACYAITVRVESGGLWCALVKQTLRERLQEGQRELPLGGGGLLRLRIGLEFTQNLVAGGHLVGRYGLRANALGKG